MNDPVEVQNIFEQYPIIWASIITALGGVLLWALQRWASRPRKRDYATQYREELRAENQDLRDENRDLREELDETREKIVDLTEKLLDIKRQLAKWEDD